MTYDVVIVTYNSADVIIETLDSVFAQSMPPAQVFVVDSASQDNTLDILKNYKGNVTVLPQSKNIGFGRGNEVGFKLSKSDSILLVNPDVRLDRDCAKYLIDTLFSDNKCAAVSPMIYEGWGDSKELYGYGAVVTHYGFGLNLTPDMPYEPNSFTGACALIRTDVAQKYGFEKSYFLYYEEPELAVRLLKEGWKFLRNDRAICHHLSGHSGPAQAAAALGFRQYYGIQNRWFSLGKHWPFPLIIPALLFNILHLGYFTIFYLKNRQFGRLGLLFIAPVRFISGLLHRSKKGRMSLSQNLVTMSFGEMLGVGKAVTAEAKDNN